MANAPVRKMPIVLLTAHGDDKLGGPGRAVLDVSTYLRGGGGVGMQVQLHDARRSLMYDTPRHTPIPIQPITRDETPPRGLRLSVGRPIPTNQITLSVFSRPLMDVVRPTITSCENGATAY